MSSSGTPLAEIVDRAMARAAAQGLDDLSALYLAAEAIVRAWPALGRSEAHLIALGLRNRILG